MQSNLVFTSSRVWKFLPVITLGILLCWVYAPTFQSLVNVWIEKSQYSHGFLVPLFSLYILWTRREQLQGAEWQSNSLGSVVLGVALALHLAGQLLYFDWFSQISVLFLLTGFCLVFGGKKAMNWAWPALAFLFFMVPLPFRLETALSAPLQKIATTASVYVLQTCGFVAFAQGNVIHFGEYRIGIVEACNGVSMLIVFFALSVSITMIVRRSMAENIVIWLSAIPIALLANVTRIVVTALLYQVTTTEIAQGFFHDVAGWLMMVFALGLLWLELQLLSWLLVPAEDSADMVKNSFADLRGSIACDPTPSEAKAKTPQLSAG